MAPTRLAAIACASISPEPKWPASAQAPMVTAMASAVDSEPDGDFSFSRPSSVWPSRSSRKIVTMRMIS